MCESHCALRSCTGSLLTSACHTLVEGKTGQEVPGTVRPAPTAAVPPAASVDAASAATAAAGTTTRRARRSTGAILAGRPVEVMGVDRPVGGPAAPSGRVTERDTPGMGHSGQRWLP